MYYRPKSVSKIIVLRHNLIHILSGFNSKFTPYIDLNSSGLFMNMLYLICKVVRTYSVFLKTKTKYGSDFDLSMNLE